MQKENQFITNFQLEDGYLHQLGQKLWPLAISVPSRLCKSIIESKIVISLNNGMSVLLQKLLAIWSQISTSTWTKPLCTSLKIIIIGTFSFHGL